MDIPDALLERARSRARSDGSSLRALVAEGLRRVLEEESPAQAYRYEPVVFQGERGVRPGVDLADWAQIRDLVYADRGA